MQDSGATISLDLVHQQPQENLPSDLPADIVLSAPIPSSLFLPLSYPCHFLLTLVNQTLPTNLDDGYQPPSHHLQ